MEVVVPFFKNEKKLILNAERREKIKVRHLYMGVDQSAWRGTRKLVSSLGESALVFKWGTCVLKFL